MQRIISLINMVCGVCKVRNVPFEIDQGGDKPAPSSRLMRFRYPSEGQHRVAEEIKWRNETYLSLATFLLSVLTFLSAFVAGVYAVRTYRAAYAQAHTAKDTEERQLRAYVGPSAFGIASSKLTPDAEIFVSFHNYGQTPAESAFDLDTIGVQACPGQQNIFLIADYSKTVRPGVRDTIFPGTDHTYTIDSGLSAADVKSFEGDQQCIVDYGTNSYQDVFGHWWGEDFCFYLKGPKLSPLICGNHNGRAIAYPVTP